MKISIITPSFNQGRFIEDAIQSVLMQDYPDFEHIVIDNCSTDNTIEILKKYNHIKWISEPDKGQSDALNKGFKMSCGEIIGWLNCDDFYIEGAFKKAAEEFSDTNIDGIYADLKFCDIDKNIVKHYSSHRPAKFLSLFHAFISSESFFFKRKIIDEKMEVKTNLHYCMDQDFAAGILYNNYKLKYINTCFAVFRWQGNNKSLNTPQLRKKRITEGIRIFNSYNGVFKVNENKNINHRLYSLTRNLLKPYRLFLRLTT
jgi:glycosyltransferase involved in cell wall biosynthesis